MRTSHFYLYILLIAGLSACHKSGESELQAVDQENVYSGGQHFTTFDFGENAFGQEGNALSRQESRLFVSGNSLFRSNWVAAPASVESLDGIGPVMNAISCGSCHFKDGRAAPPDEFGVIKPGLLFRLSVEGQTANGAPAPHPVYGGQLQDRALPGVDAEAEVITTYEQISGKYADGTAYSLRKPIYTIQNAAYGPIGSYALSPRIAPQLAGLGLLESIRTDDILAFEDIDDRNKDGISGKANYVWDEGKQTLSLGRFGWKANQPSIMQQNAGAFNGDMGLTSDLFGKDDFTPTQLERYPDLIDGGNPEVSEEQLARITLYVQALAVPAKRNTDKPEYLQGKQLFNELQCNLCHQPSYTTGAGNALASLDEQKIYPYTDMLLHDMGEGLADNRPDFKAGGSEWRTAPLWGIGLIPVVNGHNRLLHDGRARSIEEAILWHGGEAENAKENFKQLTKNKRESLIFFLKSI